MNRLRKRFSNLTTRRQALAILSGSLILLALAVGSLFKLPAFGKVLMTAAALVAGWDIALRAWNSLRNRHVSIELLVTLAAGGALLIGETWEAAAVTFLFIFGAYLEARTLSRTRQVLQSLLEVAPTTAIVLRDGVQVEALPEEVIPGEIVLVKPGAKIAVDGEVIQGASAVDESAITGEPMPEQKSAGSTVYAGTVNGIGLLHVKATGVGADTTLARIIRRVEEAQEEKAPTQRFIERFARWYTPAIIALSGVVFLISRSVELSLTLLVIGCPGALVISTPVSVVAGIGRAAHRGILIKGGEYLENAGKISAVALDKTGTLTAGKPRVTDVIVFEPETWLAAKMLEPTNAGVAAAGSGRISTPLAPAGVQWMGQRGPEEILRLAAIAEAGSEHPLARAILSAASELGPLPPADSFEAFPGKGIRAAYNGSEIVVGGLELMTELGIALPDDAQVRLERLQGEARTAVLVAYEGRAVGILGISDPLRPDSPELVRRLHAAGVKRVVMLTGDDELTAQAIARQTGIDELHAGLLPEEKLEQVRRLQQEGYVVAMVGDGINDAPALAAADIGIAMGAAGSGVAIETADIALMADDLMKIPEAVRLSRLTLNNIRQNVIIALVTVSLLLAGVLFGEVGMAGGMLVHEASVLVVIVNGMRLLRS